MPVRTVTEWRCKRCGREDAIASSEYHGWMSIGVSGYQNNPRTQLTGVRPISGDICPDCVEALKAWWEKR